MMRGAGARMTGEGAGTATLGAGTRTRPITRRPEEADWRPEPEEPTTELTVWETRGLMADTTWLTTSLLELELEGVEVDAVVAGLAGLRLEDPEIAELTV